MKNLTKRDVYNIYDISIRVIHHDYNQNKFEKCIRDITFLSDFISQLNWKYCDESIEDILMKLSSRIIEHKIEKQIAGKYVFYDFLGKDNCTLTQQYLRALMSWGVEILYIPEQLNETRSKDIISELSSYDKAEIFQPNKSLSVLDCINELYSKIVEYKPEKIILQLAPFSAEPVILFNAIKLPDKYYLDISDHRFFIGNQCADYYLSFRNRGCYIAEHFRNISRDKILYMPYYPITRFIEYEGMPSFVENSKCIILSGGSLYKIGFIESEYFQILKQVLDENQDTVFVFVCLESDYKGSVLSRFVKNNHYENRVFISSFRKDIDEVIKRCDIYYNTYPFSGGLMCQYAAKNAKPIVAYNLKERTSDFVETVICDRERIQITYCTVEDAVNEFAQLIKDVNYRHKKGTKLRDAIYTPERFNDELFQLIHNNTTVNTISSESFFSEKIFERYLKLNNSTQYYCFLLVLRNHDVFHRLPLLLRLKIIIHLAIKAVIKFTNKLSPNR